MHGMSFRSMSGLLPISRIALEQLLTCKPYFCLRLWVNHLLRLEVHDKP